MNKEKSAFYEVSKKGGEAIEGAPVILINVERKKTATDLSNILSALNAVMPNRKSTPSTEEVQNSRQYTYEAFLADIGQPDINIYSTHIGDYSLFELFKVVEDIRKSRNMSPQNDAQFKMMNSIINTMTKTFASLINEIKQYLQESQKEKPDERELKKIAKRIKITVDGRQSIHDIIKQKLPPKQEKAYDFSDNQAGLTIGEWFQYLDIAFGMNSPMSQIIKGFIDTGNTKGLKKIMDNDGLDPEKIRAIIAKNSTSPQNQS